VVVPRQGKAAAFSVLKTTTKTAYHHKCTAFCPEWQEETCTQLENPLDTLNLVWPSAPPATTCGGRFSLSCGSDGSSQFSLHPPPRLPGRPRGPTLASSSSPSPPPPFRPSSRRCRLLHRSPLHAQLFYVTPWNPNQSLLSPRDTWQIIRGFIQSHVYTSGRIF